MAPTMPPDYNKDPTPEEAAAGRKSNKPVLIGLGIFLVGALGYWAWTVFG